MGVKRKAQSNTYSGRCRHPPGHKLIHCLERVIDRQTVGKPEQQRRTKNDIFRFVQALPKCYFFPDFLNVMKRCKQVHKFRYLVMTRACVLLSILLANSRAWPQSPPFMAASSASYSIDEVEHVSYVKRS